MPAIEKVMMAKLEGARMAAMAKGASGKAFIVSKVTTAGGTMGNTVVLTPAAGVAKAAGSAKAVGVGAGSLTLKLEGAKQATGLKALIGKSVIVGKAPMAGGNWLVLKPGAAIVAKATGAVGTVAVASGVATGKTTTGAGLALAKVEGARQGGVVKGLMGKTFTVVDPATVGKAGKSILLLKPTGVAATKAVTTMTAAGGMKAAAELEGAAAMKGAGAKAAVAVKGVGELEGAAAMKGAGGMKAAASGKGLVTIQLAGKKQAMALKGMIGKKVTLDAPMLAGKGGAGNWLALKAAPGACVKTAAGAGIAKGATVTKVAVVPKAAMTSKVAMATKTIGSKSVITAGAIKGTVASGTIWTGTGWSLGLGLGLGALGPAILGAAVAGAGYAYYRKKTQPEESDSDDADLDEAFLNAIS